MIILPTLDYERELAAAGHRYLIGLDEVGRGALAGPVSVGAVAVDLRTLAPLPGVRDSKLLSAKARQDMLGAIHGWALASGVGHASPQEIDACGLSAALGLAGRRALSNALRAMEAAGIDSVGTVALVDGNYDWLTPRPSDLFAAETPAFPPVTTRIKADLNVTTVAAASVIAKVERDALMARLHEEFPHYGWSGNKGYAAAVHRAAISEHGPCSHHRLSWKLTSERIDA